MIEVVVAETHSSKRKYCIRERKRRFRDAEDAYSKFLFKVVIGISSPVVLSATFFAIKDIVRSMSTP
jgi:hypothetical protein